MTEGKSATRCLRLTLPLMPNGSPTKLILAEKTTKSKSRNATKSTKSKKKTNIPARNAALRTVEILENILLFLPMRDLLLSQGVCKTWYNVINASIRIQRALFFAPILHPKGVLPDRFLPNPLLNAVFELHFTIGSKPRLKTRGKEKHLTTQFKVHGIAAAWEAGMQHRCASWRRMLLSQPPVQSVVAEDCRIAPYWEDVYEDFVVDERGVRLGQVLMYEADCD